MSSLQGQAKLLPALRGDGLLEIWVLNTDKTMEETVVLGWAAVAHKSEDKFFLSLPHATSWFSLLFHRLASLAATQRGQD